MSKAIEITPKDIAKAINDLLEENERLQQENKQLKEQLAKLKTHIKTIKRNCKRDKAKLRNRNRKAIEYINNASYFDGSSMCANDLLQILGYKEKDIEFDVLKALNTDLDDDVEMG